jgi:hypothetical protein
MPGAWTLWFAWLASESECPVPVCGATLRAARQPFVRQRNNVYKIQLLEPYPAKIPHYTSITTRRGARNMTAKDELKALAAECLEKNNMNAYRAMEEFKEIVSKRPDLLEVVERQFDHVLLVNPNLLSINDPPDKLPQA